MMNEAVAGEGREVGRVFPELIDELLAQRAELSLIVDTEAVRWRAVAARIGEMESAIARLVRHADAWPDVQDEVQQMPMRELRERIAAIQDQLGSLALRLARSTVTIAVSGQARVGKSQMLQSISGLGNDVIPVASGRPVTAVPVRLNHSKGQPRAEALLHSVVTFLEAHVWPFHRQLGLSLPADLESFEAFRYPPENEWPVDSERVLLARLAQTKAALPLYRDLLGKGLAIVPLDEVRGHVAYPTSDEERAGAPRRLYLAVREMRIHCAFQHGDVGRLSLVDLPGLGEAVPEAERHHLIALRDEVDVVLMTKRPVEGLAYWTNADKATLALLEEARGRIRKTADFVLIAVNRATNDPQPLADALEESLSAAGLMATRGGSFSILRTDAVDPVRVGTDVLEPLLKHLADRLPRMDRDLLDAVADDAAQVESAVRRETAALRALLARLRSRTSVPAELLDEQADVLHKSLSVALKGLVDELREEADFAYQDEDYITAVDEARADIRRWIRQGLGGEDGSGPADPQRVLPTASGLAQEPTAEQPSPWALADEQIDPRAAAARGRWVTQAQFTMVRDGNAGTLAAEELSRVRVHISRRFSAIDAYFERRVLRLHERVVSAVEGCTGDLLRPGEDETGSVPNATRRLEHLRGLLQEGYEPCPELSNAVADLVAVRLDYRTQLHPLVRSHLNDLTLEVLDPVTERRTAQVAVEPTHNGAEELYEFICMRAEQATFETSQDLISRSVLPALVLFAAAEQFEDALIRSGGAKREFRRLARTYRNELWPRWSDGLAGEHARFASVSHACDAVDAALAGRLVQTGSAKEDR